MSPHTVCWSVPGVCLIACLVGSQLSTTNIPLTSVPDVNCSSVNITECKSCSSGTYSNNVRANLVVLEPVSLTPEVPSPVPACDTKTCLCCSSGSCINSLDCLPCASGFYQPQSSRVTCLPCPRGFYTNTTGSVVCQSCQPGYFSNETASMICTPCEKGSFTSDQNATQCKPCPLGSFCNNTTCTSCVVCPSGEESLNIGSVDCTSCRPGMYKGPEDKKCLYCRDGEYQEKWGGDHCEVCPVDHYCPSPDISPISCPADAFCPAGSTEPSYCMETFLRKDGNSCKLAPLTIILLVVCGVALFSAVIFIVRKQKRTSERREVIGFSPKSPLLRPQRSSSSIYGMSYDAEPMYAGW